MASDISQKALLSRIKTFQKDHPVNRRCAICSDVGTTYICMTYGTFVCTPCSGLHREINHKVRGISVSKWTLEDVTFIENGGNQKFKDIYFARLRSDDSWQLPEVGNIEKLRPFLKSLVVDQKWMLRDRKSSETTDQKRKPSHGTKSRHRDDISHHKSPRSKNDRSWPKGKKVSSIEESDSSPSPKKKKYKIHSRRRSSPTSSDESSDYAHVSPFAEKHSSQRHPAQSSDSRNWSSRSSSESSDTPAPTKRTETSNKVKHSHSKHKRKANGTSKVPTPRGSISKPKTLNPFADDLNDFDGFSNFNNNMAFGAGNSTAEQFSTVAHKMPETRLPAELFNMTTPTDSYDSSAAQYNTAPLAGSLTFVTGSISDAVAHQRYSGDPFTTIDSAAIAFGCSKIGGLSSFGSNSYSQSRAGSRGSIIPFQSTSDLSAEGFIGSTFQGSNYTAFASATPTTIPINPVNYSYNAFKSTTPSAHPTYAPVAVNSQSQVPISFDPFQIPSYPSLRPQPLTESQDPFAGLSHAVLSNRSSQKETTVPYSHPTIDFTKVTEEQKQQYMTLRRQQELLAQQIVSLEKAMIQTISATRIDYNNFNTSHEANSKMTSGEFPMTTESIGGNIASTLSTANLFNKTPSPSLQQNSVTASHVIIPSPLQQNSVTASHVIIPSPLQQNSVTASHVIIPSPLQQNSVTASHVIIPSPLQQNSVTASHVINPSKSLWSDCDAEMTTTSAASYNMSSNVIGVDTTESLDFTHSVSAIDAGFGVSENQCKSTVSHQTHWPSPQPMENNMFGDADLMLTSGPTVSEAKISNMTNYSEIGVVLPSNTVSPPSLISTFSSQFLIESSDVTHSSKENHDKLEQINDNSYAVPMSLMDVLF